MPTVPPIRLQLAPELTSDCRFLRIGLALWLLTVIAYSSNAKAQTPADEAKERYRKGTAAYNLGKYAEAAQEYELSYRASLDPALLFNVAQAYRLAGDRKKALTAYRSYLRSAPDGDKRELAEAKVRELQSAIDYDDPFAGGSAAPISKPAPTPAPEPTPAHHPPGMEAMMPAPTAPLLVTEASSQPQPPPPEPLYRRWPFWAAVAGVAVAIVVVTVVASESSSPQAPQTTYGVMRF